MYGQTCRDIIGGSLRIKDRLVLTENTDLTVRETKIRGNAIVQKKLTAEELCVTGNTVITEMTVNDKITTGELCVTGNTVITEMTVNDKITTGALCVTGDTEFLGNVTGLPNSAVPTNIVQSIKTNIFSTNHFDWLTVPGLEVTITPSSTTSKILVQVMVSCAAGLGGWSGYIRLCRNNVHIFIADGEDLRIPATVVCNTTGNDRSILSSPIIYLDSPATTSATTYCIQGFTLYGLLKINASSDDSSVMFTTGRAVSSIIAQEIIQ
jgi:hypothetical protein